MEFFFQHHKDDTWSLICVVSGHLEGDAHREKNSFIFCDLEASFYTVYLVICLLSFFFNHWNMVGLSVVCQTYATFIYKKPDSQACSKSGLSCVCSFANKILPIFPLSVVSVEWKACGAGFEGSRTEAKGLHLSLVPPLLFHVAPKSQMLRTVMAHRGSQLSPV